MTKKNGTKRSLLMSALALVLCLSMLVGSTFAWFTDSVTSSGNIIKSGTLDVEMSWANGTEDPSAENTTWEDAAEGAIFNSDKWEPGYVEVRHLKIENKGTLALKYQLNIIPNGDVSELAKVIDVYFIQPAQLVADRAALANVTPIGTLDKVLDGSLANLDMDGEMGAGATNTMTIALKMQETAGNEYQNMSIGSEFAVQLLATQETDEADSFNDQYDANAAYPIVSVPVTLPTTSASVTVTTAATTDAETTAVTVTIPGEVVEALTSNATAEPVTSVALVHTEPVVDTTEQKITFDAVDLVDQNGKVIDLEAMNNSEPVSVTLNVGTAFAVGDVVAIYHDDVEVARDTVDDNKNVTYEVEHFCEVTIVPGGTIVSTEAELKKAIEKGEDVVLANSIQLTKTLLVKKDVVIDLNGYIVSANMSQNPLFQSSSDTDPSMIITSSKPGAKINAGDKSVLLGYGSTEFYNVEINVGEIKSSTYTTFKVYGDLTLGEGTVVNVDYLGTSLISNNGKVAIVIDGAEINVGTFKVNGGAMISLTSGTTLALNDTGVTVGLDTTYTSYFISKAENATIEDCTFTVTANSATYDIEYKPDDNVGARYVWVVKN